ncbi:MAG TPA: radical SAM protein [Nitrospirae bacterium]|nr:radical SAM superfamily protein [bacterium BMS3Abin10]GBE38057.1 radical SAM superfamily protein [bacterium BMS3Bbin08]HDH50781.1 radical SAM protein [Nitrospirota bacterium]HDK17017.1 radical SAM protein [Nitrospirota bacterium]HDK81821.1 radical SAM protein [Nitrospirota bacterium]
MRQKVKEIEVRSVLTKTGIPGKKYCINPYIGCVHACKYCYATFMKKFTGHIEPWGSFVDVKINAPERLEKQLKRAERGDIIMSSVTDPYQPVESKYMITRKCLEIIASHGFPVDILTKSPLVLRDIDIISEMNAEVGITITTDDDSIRRIFEPNAPVISARIEALKTLHKKGIDTYVFIGPCLPMDPEALARKIRPYVNSVLIDRMNYESRAKGLYRKFGMEKWLDDKYITEIIMRLKKGFSDKQVEVC